jgi:hypothetical protein
VNPFSLLNKSIVSPQVYREIILFSPWRPLRFFIVMCVMTAFVSGGSRTFYAFDPVSGLPAQVSTAFSGMEIRDGRLIPQRPTPYVPDASHLSAVLNTIFCIPHFFDSLPESFLVVDTAKEALATVKPQTQILLSSQYMYIGPKSSMTFKIPYTSLMQGKTAMSITAESIKEFCMKHIVSMVLHFSAISGMAAAGVFLFSIIFLAFAAYIFRIERKVPVGRFFVMACYAASPIYIGTNLVVLSGTSLQWTWHVLIFISTIVMFRGARASGGHSGFRDAPES